MISLRLWASAATMALAALLPGQTLASYPTSVPSVQVTACPHFSVIHFNKTIPDQQPFPYTEVDLCYNDDSITMLFNAHNESFYYYDPDQGTNGDIWKYETYLEFEVNPNNVNFHAFIYNPTKVRADNATFEHFFIPNGTAAGFYSYTVQNRENKSWGSTVGIPLGLFNVDNGTAKGTKWRMNFFRTVVDPATYPNQTLGAWSSPDKASFHITPFFGHVEFV
ncbi:Translation initiation factor 3 subunit b [Apiospora arundinis]